MSDSELFHGCFPMAECVEGIAHAWLTNYLLSVGPAKEGTIISIA